MYAHFKLHLTCAYALRSFMIPTLALGSIAMAATNSVEVTVDQNSSGRKITPEFVGFSYEKNVLSSPLFSAQNTGMVALFKRLGPGILRMGGSTVDWTIWDSTGAGKVFTKMAPSDMRRLGDFLRAANWKVIYGVNLNGANANLGASEAASAKSILGDRLLAFEMGNEPNYFGWTYAKFLTTWEGFRVAMAKRAPGIPFTGPATAGLNSSWVKSFAHDEGKNISILTMHNYLGSGGDASSTVGKLLAPPSASFLSALRDFDTTAANAKISSGYRMAETNSYSSGGRGGVSDSYGSAIWAVDYMFTLAVGGSTGINFHGGGKTPGYTAIANDPTTGNIVQVRPEYYAIHLFSLISHGRVRAAKVSGNATLPAWTIDDTDGTFHVVLLNEDSTNSVQATIHPGTGYLAASSYAMTGTHLHDSVGVTFGGAEIGIDGAWNPRATAWTLKGDSLQTTVAPVSAQVFTFRKSSAIVSAQSRSQAPTSGLPAFDATGRRLGLSREDMEIRFHAPSEGQSKNTSISVIP